MARRMKNKLTAAVVQQATKPGYMNDGSGLVLQVTASGAKTWLFRYRSPTGRVREMGLGSASTVKLAAARLKAQEAQRQRDEGLDPIEVKRQRAAQAKIDAAKGRTFRWCSDQFIEANKTGWRNAKHAAQWAATLEAYAYPVFGNLPVASVDTTLITQVLRPIWSGKHETASRLRQRIERVLAWATTGGYRAGENPARWHGHLENMLPNSKDIRKTRPIKHHRALPADEVPALMSELAEREGGSASALRFLALTASRTGEVIGATWSEIDMAAKVWTIPPGRMKGGKEHRVPLSAPAMDILREAAKAKVSDVVFNGPKPGHSLSNMAFAALLKRMKRTDFVPHGLRSTFRTWAAERTNYPREVCEMALAHTIGNATERSYQRGDMFERRRRLMADWARFATSPVGKATGKGSVVSLPDRKA
jgi:integrase